MKLPRLVTSSRAWLIAGIAGALAASFSAGVWAQSVAARQNPAALWHWPDAMDSVNAAPKNHKVLFENDHVRLLEVVVQPGETENMHGHKYPSVFMMDAPQPHTANKILDDGNAGAPDARPGGNRPPPPPRNEGAEAAWPTCRAMTTPQSPHQVTNTDTFPQHFYRMEFKKIDGEAIREMKSYPASQAEH
jgi:hypothetical protein